MNGSASSWRSDMANTARGISASVAKDMANAADLSEQLEKSHKELIQQLSMCKELFDCTTLAMCADIGESPVDELVQEQPSLKKDQSIAIEIRVKEPERRGISAEQLKTFFTHYCGVTTGGIFKAFSCLPTKLAERVVDQNLQDKRNNTPRGIALDTNLYAVNEFFLKPHTENEKVSYAEMLNPEGLEVEFFISHHWGEDFGEFVQSVLNHARLHDGDPRLPLTAHRKAAKTDKFLQIVYWCCAFANNQHVVELGDSITDSPFYKVLVSKGCLGTVMNLNQMMTALTRIWCIYETYLSTILEDRTFEINTRYGPLVQDSDFVSAERDLWVLHMNTLLEHIDVQDAEASQQRDKDLIMAEIKNLERNITQNGLTVKMHGADALNKTLRHKVAELAIFTLAQQGEVEHLQAAIGYGVDPDKADGQGLRPLSYATDKFFRVVERVTSLAQQYRSNDLDALGRTRSLSIDLPDTPKKAISCIGTQSQQNDHEGTSSAFSFQRAGTRRKSVEHTTQSIEAFTAELVLEAHDRALSDLAGISHIDELKVEIDDLRKQVARYKETIDILVRNGANQLGCVDAVDVLEMFSAEQKVRQAAMQYVRGWKAAQKIAAESKIDILVIAKQSPDNIAALEDAKDELALVERDQFNFKDFHKGALEKAIEQHVTKLSIKFGLSAHAANSAGHLGYAPGDSFISKSYTIIERMHDFKETGVAYGNHLKELMQQYSLHGDPPQRPHATHDAKRRRDRKLMVVFTDLEPDDTMGITQLWQWKLRNNELDHPPIIVFVTDFADKDAGYVFDKKLLVAALMMGVTQYHIITDRTLDPSKSVLASSRYGCEVENSHPNAANFHAARDDALKQLVNDMQRAAKDCSVIDTYVMSPGRGVLGEVWQALPEEVKQKRWRIAMYTGNFNIVNSRQEDFDAITEIARLANADGEPLLDVGKYPFFGCDTYHPWTASLTTFAMESFPQELNNLGDRGKYLAAALKHFNDEHNASLIEPKPGLFQVKGTTKKAKSYDEALNRKDARRFERIAELYKKSDGKALKEYAKSIIAEPSLYCSVLNFKKSTLMAFAHGACDSPLCDQLIFLSEWILAKSPHLFEDIHYGVWIRKKNTEVDRKHPIDTKDGIAQWVKKNPTGCIAFQPRVWDPYDEDSLMKMRHSLQKYCLLHIKAVYEKNIEDSRHAADSAGNLIYKPTARSVSTVERIVNSTSGGQDLASVLRQQGFKLQPPPPVAGKSMLIFITDLEPDDCMAISELWYTRRVSGDLYEEPIIVYITDFAKKDRGTIMDKKLLIAALMFGKLDPAYVLAGQAPKGKQAESTTSKKAQCVYEAREKVIRSLQGKIQKFKGEKIEVYIMAPGRGCLQDIFGMELRSDVKWKIGIYSGSFNMRHMTVEDLDTIKLLGSKAHVPLVDMASFTFFGAEKKHPWTASLTTFANTTFAMNVSMQNNLLAAALKTFDIEHNSNLIKPEWDEKDSTYHIFEKGKLSEQKIRSFRELVAPLWKHGDPQACQKYCKKIFDGYFSEVKNFKKSTISAMMHGGCDTALCDQLLFLQEWMQQHLKESLVPTAVGRWKFVSDDGGEVNFTQIEPMTSVTEGGIVAIQPRLKDPLDEDALKTMREALENTFLNHLRSISCEQSQLRVRTCGNLMYSPTRQSLLEANEWIAAVAESSSLEEMRQILDELMPVRKKIAWQRKFLYGDGDTMLVFFTDLRADDVMSITQLWNFKNEHRIVGVEPLVIYIDQDYSRDDASTNKNFAMKVLTATLMTGISDFHVLLPVGKESAEERPWGPAEALFQMSSKVKAVGKEIAEGRPLSQMSSKVKAVGKEIAERPWGATGSIPQMLNKVKATRGDSPRPGSDGTTRWEEVQAKQKQILDKAIRRINDFYGSNIEVYVTCNPQGNLAAFYEALTKAKATSKFHWRTTVYSGSFNMAELKERDKLALNALSTTTPMIDIHAHVFFGEHRRHPWTHVMSTFATEWFVAELNLNSPVLVAILKLSNDSANSARLDPQRQAIFSEKLSDEELAIFDAEVAPLYHSYRRGESADLLKYCSVLSASELYYKLRNSIRNTVASRASGGCDLPLAHQLLFMREWLSIEDPADLVEDVGEWEVRELKSSDDLEELGCTFVDVSKDRASMSFPALRPRLKDPEDESLLTKLREATTKHVVNHVQLLNPDNEMDVSFSVNIPLCRRSIPPVNADSPQQDESDMFRRDGMSSLKTC